MTTIERLKHLESLIWYYLPGDESQKCGWSPCDDIRFKEALHEAWPKLRDVIEAADSLELRADRAVEFLRSSGHLSEAARLDNAVRVYNKAAAEL